MDWKQEAVSGLRKLEDVRGSIGFADARMRQLDEEMTAIRSSLRDAPAVLGSGGGAEDRMIAIIAEREELRRLRNYSAQWVALVDGAVAQMGDEDREVLDLCFIHSRRGAIDELCARLNIERSTAYRRREAALLSFVRKFYGFVET